MRQAQEGAFWIDHSDEIAAAHTHVSRSGH